MNAYQVAELLAAMIKAGEGGTVRRSGDPLPSRGYYVGGLCESLVFESVADVDRGEVAWFIGNHFASYYGVWVDTDDNKVYIDAVSHFIFRKNALVAGKARGEIAVWDIKNSCELRVAELEG